MIKQLVLLASAILTTACGAATFEPNASTSVPQSTDLPSGICGNLFRDADTAQVILHSKHSNHVVIGINTGAIEKLQHITTTPSPACVFFRSEKWKSGEPIPADQVTDGPIKGGIIISN